MQRSVDVAGPRISRLVRGEEGCDRGLDIPAIQCGERCSRVYDASYVGPVPEWVCF